MENENYADVVYPVHIPDPFDTLANIAVEDHGLFDRPAPEGLRTWWLFKGIGKIPDNFLR